MKKILSILVFFTVVSMNAQEKEPGIPLEGMASYYHDKFEGKPTASGELYQKDSLTAAHPTLPFNSLVRVTNPENDKSVLVRINDRGPFAKERIIDVSRAAAEILGFVQEGVTRVKIEVIE
ncbi:septal ring lytic transglycosylase RlpA family protein [Robertkochia flava]|uniref:septal ring lytic transglycosylase RlpA family protein n=1 Tax=Robertkochia flava TaxID=3447986 RepID=UPI001CD03C90|nr:septal ring lytic transglycosylase RlpA family protein [Robertkochia marina]